LKEASKGFHKKRIVFQFFRAMFVFGGVEELRGDEVTAI